MRSIFKRPNQGVCTGSIPCSSPVGTERDGSSLTVEAQLMNQAVKVLE